MIVGKLIGAGLVLYGGYLLVNTASYSVKVSEWESEPDQSAADVDVLARTIWGEARGDGAAGMAAVAAVIMNRVRRGGWWGNSVRDVCLKPYQFSAWNTFDPNRLRMLNVDGNDQAFAVALEIARAAVSGSLPDPTGGATHYHAKSVNPKWAATGTQSAIIGGHVFYFGVA